MIKAVPVQTSLVLFQLTLLEYRSVLLVFHASLCWCVGVGGCLEDEDARCAQNDNGAQAKASPHDNAREILHALGVPASSPTNCDDRQQVEPAACR